MKRNLSVVTALCASLSPLQALHGQTAEDFNEGTRISYDSGQGTFSVSWWGRPGYYYFLQYSEGIEDPEGWHWYPLVEEGFGEPIEWGGATNTDRFFLRLIFTDDPEAPVMRTDFNGTGFSTWEEIQLGTDPFVWEDTAGNGLPDVWELNYFQTTGVDPEADYDGDGQTNLEEYLAGTDPTQRDHPDVQLQVFKNAAK